jgi:hypothetical protein
MKQIYSILTALFATFAVASSASAGTAEVKFHCPLDHVNEVTVVSQYYSYDTYSTVTEDGVWDETGTVTFTYDTGKAQYYTFTIADDSEYLIKGITYDYTQGEHGAYGYNSDDYKSYTAYMDWSAVYNNTIEVFEGTLEFVTYDEKYSDTLYLTIDDPASAAMRFTGSKNREIPSADFEPGVEKAIKFDASEETYLAVQNTLYYQKGVYQVYKNDEQVYLDYPQYVNLEIAADDHVKLVFNYPDETRHISLVCKNADLSEDYEGLREAITGATVDDVAVEDFKNGFDAQLGSIVRISVDEDWYNITSLSVNGVNEQWFSFPYQFLLNDDTEIVLGGSKYDALTVNVNVDSSDRVKVYHGYNSSDENLVALEDGDNQLEFSAGSASMIIAPADGCEILSILQLTEDEEGNPVETELYTNLWSRSKQFYNVEDGWNLKVTSAELVRNNQFVFYADDPSVAEWGFNLSRSDSSSFIDQADAQGYSIHYFGDPKPEDVTDNWPENKVTFSHYGPVQNDYNHVYLNDEVQTPDWSTYYTLTVSDKDVLKVYIASNPEFYNVSFDVPEDVELSVVKDLITEASLEGFQALTGTQVDLTFNSELDGYEVYLNDEKVEVEENAYRFNVAADTVVKVTLAGENGISAVSADSLRGNVYNLQGISVGTDLNRLPAGIYILNGKKVAVK